MGILTADMKRVVGEQRLGFFATVCEDGSPNLSPKGTTYVLDDDHLVFAEIRSPQTVANVRRGSAVEVNVVDPFVKGYRFKGPAIVYEPGTPTYAEALDLCAGPDRASPTASGPSSSSRCAMRVRWSLLPMTTARAPRPTSAPPTVRASPAFAARDDRRRPTDVPRTTERGATAHFSVHVAR